MYKYALIFFSNGLNLLLGIVVFLNIPENLISFFFEIGILSYLLISSSYFGLFGMYLKKGVRYGFNSILIHRKFTFFFFFPILLFFGFYGSLSTPYILVFLLIFMMWILAPYELILRKVKTNSQEIRIEFFRQVLLSFTKVVIIFYPSKPSLILSVFLLYFFNFITSMYVLRHNKVKEWIYCGLKSSIFKVQLDKVYGSIFSIFVYFIVQIDYFHLTYVDSNYSKITALAHKLEEYIILMLSAFNPWFHREVISNKFRIARYLPFLITMLALFLFGFYLFSQSYKIFMIDKLIASDTLRLIIENYEFMYLFFISAAIFIFSDIVYIEISSNKGFSIKVTVIFISALLTLYLALLLLISDEFVQILRISIVLLLSFFYIYIYIRQKKIFTK